MTNESVFIFINGILKMPVALNEKYEMLDELSWKIVNHHPQGRMSEALSTVLWIQENIAHRIYIGDLDEYTPLISNVVG
jgi:hypothetical protein